MKTRPFYSMLPVLLVWVHLVASSFGYDITTVPDLGGGLSSVYPWAINNNGVVVGWSKTINGQTHAFSFSSGVFCDLGTLGGSNSFAYGINDDGVIVGEAQTANGTHAFCYSNGVMVDLTPGLNSSAQSINSSGVIIGGFSSNKTYYPCIFKGGQIIIPDLDGRANQVRLLAINDKEEIIGRYLNSNGLNLVEKSFLLRNGVASDFGASGGGYGRDCLVSDVNNSSQCVGCSGEAGSLYLIWYNGLNIRPFSGEWDGYRNGSATRLNDNNQAIGFIRESRYITNLFIYHEYPCLYDDTLGFTNLEQIGSWGVQQLTAINNAGQMCAVATNQGIVQAIIISPFQYGLTPPAMVRQPRSATSSPGGTASFWVTVDPASGTNIQYQWFFSQSAIKGATGSQLILTNVQTADAGNYSVKVSNPAGTVSSDQATLSVVLARRGTNANGVDLVLYGQIGYDYSITSTTNLGLNQWNVETNFNLTSKPSIWSANANGVPGCKFFKVERTP